MNKKTKKNKKDDKSLKSITQANRKAIAFVISSIIAGVGIIIFLFYYFFYSDLKKAKDNDEELYFAILFIDENNIPYGAYFGIISSLHNRIGIIGLPKNIGLWKNKNDKNIPLNKLYETGGREEVFKAIEITTGKKISYKIAVDNNQISDIIDLIGGVRMYIEEAINIDNLSFDVGERFFQGDKAVSYLNYLTIEGYEEIELGYDLVDTNEFTKQQLLEDNLVTSKAMLIEKSQNKEELYQNIEDIISCKNKMEDFEYEQLEKIVKYELMGTEDKEIISKFIEKIKNREESENIMMNAARIINKEIRKQRREGREEGMIFVAKKLKGKMHIKDISQITGLSEKEIEKL